MVGFWILAFLIYTSQFYGGGYKSTIPAIFFFFIGLIAFVYFVGISDEARKLNKTIDKILKGKERRFTIVDLTYTKVRKYAEDNGLNDELKTLLVSFQEIRKEIQNEFPNNSKKVF